MTLSPKGSRRFQSAAEEPWVRDPSATLSNRVYSRQRPGLLRLRGMPMRPYRDIATVAALQVACFSVRAHFEPQFFALHLHQTIIHGALLIYIEDRSAYRSGMLTPIA